MPWHGRCIAGITLQPNWGFVPRLSAEVSTRRGILSLCIHVKRSVFVARLGSHVHLLHLPMSLT